MKLALAVLALVVAAPVPLQGAKAIRSCAGAGPYWPTQTLAISGGTAWVACKEESRLVRLWLPSGPLRPVPLAGSPIAVLAGLGAVWALDAGGVVSRIDPRSGRVTGRIADRVLARRTTSGSGTDRSGRSTTRAARSCGSIRRGAR